MTSPGEHGWVVAYIGLGANLGDPIAQILSARHTLQQHPSLREVGFSSLYRSLPLGPQDQPDYVNAVMAAATRMTPEELLDELHRVEHAYGRVRTGEQWGPRTLDLDLLLYGDATIVSPRLHVPHPGLSEREFVLIPLFEIAPALIVPGVGPLRDLVRTCPRRGSKLVRIEHADA